MSTISSMPPIVALTGNELLEVVQDGENRKAELKELLRHPDRYDLPFSTATSILDLSTQQVFKVDATVNRNLQFTYVPPSDRVMSVIIHLLGKGGLIVWPAGIVWNNDLAPELGNQSTTISLFWTGESWLGSRYHVS